jgi:Tfp pilus assembly protein PilF
MPTNLELAFQKHENGEYAEAAALFLQMTPQIPAVRALAARSLMENQQLDEAYQEATRAVNEAGNVAATHFILGLIADRTNRLDVATQEYQQVLTMVPGDAASHNNLGGVYYMREEFEHARAETEVALGAAKDEYGVTIALGNLAEMDGLSGQLKAAEEKLDQALAAAPDQAWAYFGLASLYDVTGRTSAALTMEQHALSLDPHRAAWRATAFVWPELQVHAEALAAEASRDIARATDRWTALQQIESSGALRWAPLKGIAASHLVSLATKTATTASAFEPFEALRASAPAARTLGIAP